ncbi:DUF6088 family protein [Stutzerimonas nitrititolerans]|uniref:DUF6088 family protein n=1 Tax=Stutzerimonas nitrititolerans TaxID=2482751 RepID=UPI002897CA68|nr:DUF6088 family protein [Stutzerimonas nitrititolerans]
MPFAEKQPGGLSSTTEKVSAQPLVAKNNTIPSNGFSVQQEEIWHDGQKLRPGVWLHTTWCSREGEQTSHEWICSPLMVEAITRSQHGSDYGRLISFVNMDKQQRQWAMPNLLLAGKSDTILGTLLNIGLDVSYEHRNKITAFIAEQRPTARMIAATETGWHGDKLFIMPRQKIGEGQAVYQSEEVTTDDQAQSVSARIAQRVKRLPKGQPFSISRFTGFGTKNAVSKAIARLVKRGELERVYRGIYMRPKPGLYVARARPNLWQLISVIARQKHLSLQIHGANAVRRFGLSTQMPLIPIFYTNGASRSVFIGNAEIRLIRATPMVMQHAGTEIGMAISALYYLGKEGSTPECITAIKNELRPEDFVKLLACKLPKWMSTVLKV